MKNGSLFVSFLFLCGRCCCCFLFESQMSTKILLIRDLSVRLASLFVLFFIVFACCCFFIVQNFERNLTKENTNELFVFLSSPLFFPDRLIRVNERSFGQFVQKQRSINETFSPRLASNVREIRLSFQRCLLTLEMNTL